MTPCPTCGHVRALTPAEIDEVQEWYARAYTARKKRETYGRRYPRPHGLARLPADERRIISTQGGVAVQELGTGHRFTPEEGKAASQKRGIRATP